MSQFTVVGTDGRRIVRGVDEAYARELAAKIHASTGEHVDVVEDEGENVVSGIAQPTEFSGVDDPSEPEPDEEPARVRPRRRRTA